MKLLNKEYPLLAVSDKNLVLNDCHVISSNKIGTGHGEGKFYVASKEKMHKEFGPIGFKARCCVLKSNLLVYMHDIKEEYLNPKYAYRKYTEFPTLWEERFNAVNQLNDIEFFEIEDQAQVAGRRGYINSNDKVYNLIRTIALPKVSFIRIKTLSDGGALFLWELFVDYDAIDGLLPLALRYGKGAKKKPTKMEKKKDEEAKERRAARVGQGKYREALLKERDYCAITGIVESKLLIASHIKPWSDSNDDEKVDPKNGFILSALYDKLFDKGFITFTKDKRIVVSNFLTDYNSKKIGIDTKKRYENLPMGSKREEYLEYHYDHVFLK